MRQSDPLPVRLGRRIHALSLRIYPADFRRNFAADMQQVFANSSRDAYRDRGFLGLLRVFVHTTFDLGITAMKEHAAGNTFISILILAAILAMIFFIGWVDLHNNEPQPAALCIIVFTFILSFFRPRKPWLWAILIGLSIPLSQLFALIKGTGSLQNLLTCVIAFIPAFIGAYSGWLFRRAFSSIHQTPKTPTPQS